jgi:ADP-ribose pyrophosphatase YjhB (NUDIX family)
MRSVFCKSPVTNGAGWVFPKGGWELDETAEDTAARRLWRKGGVRGRRHKSLAATGQEPGGRGTRAASHYLFALHVEGDSHHWPERASRVRTSGYASLSFPSPSTCILSASMSMLSTRTSQYVFDCYSRKTGLLAGSTELFWVSLVWHLVLGCLRRSFVSAAAPAA